MQPHPLSWSVLIRIILNQNKSLAHSVAALHGMAATEEGKAAEKPEKG